MLPPLRIDASNIRDHYYLSPQDECYYFYDYTAGEGYAHSPGNSLISNLKKPVERRGRVEYRFKEQAIRTSAQILHSAFLQAPAIMAMTTLVPVPPSRERGDPGYDDRVMQIVSQAVQGVQAEVMELVTQQGSYAASHLQGSGGRMKPDQLRSLYRVIGAPRPVVILVDDVLTTGSHFVACRDVILAAYPTTRVIGFFVARRAMQDPAIVFANI